MGCREAIFVDKSTIDFPIFLLFFNTKFPFFPVFSILSFLFSYFFEQPCCWTPCMWVPPNIWVMKTTFRTCLSQPLLFFEEIYKTGLETRFLKGSNVILGTLLNWRLDFLRVSSSNVSVKSKLQHHPPLPPHYGLFRWSNTPTLGTKLSHKASEITAKSWMFSFS